MRKRAVYFILLFNAFIFVMMSLSGIFSTREPVLQMLLFLRYGAQYGPRVDAGDWFRLITALFVHGGILHILFNSYALYYFGLIVEDIYGTEKFLFSYFFTGVIGNIATHIFYHDTISVGASGAIFGLIGVLFAAGLRKDTPFFMRPVTGASLLPIILINVVYGFLPGTNINNAAHLGGFLTGMLLGYTMKPFSWKRRALWKAIAILTVLLVALSYAFLIKQIPEIDEAIRRFRAG
ncbi:rhomboid family intramembrane serine protease [Thermotoga sp.]|uniref:rhomboid family intramembrane serine protease n=1 Tax=Thermotoga sp. TaxID=28240 RepID=UPI0025F6E8D6|nr:rhomboid family intramembrane serine protease [Thermotoga sp.]MCD6550932.1 rhomboid family intramembrane serine protease [Thermotoga sp.]